MKFSESMNGYFKRSWRGRDMRNLGQMPHHAYRTLRMVYRTLFYAVMCCTVGSYLHLFFEVGGLFTVVNSVLSLLWLCFTSPRRVRIRDSLLMIVAFSYGASVGIFTKYFFGIDQVVVAIFLVASTIGIGTLWFGSMVTRQRSLIYIGCLFYSCGLMFFSFIVTVFGILDSLTAHSMLEVSAVLTLFMVYLVVYSQEILYDASYGDDVNFVNRTLTVFLHLPAIVVHAARLYRAAKMQQRRRHIIAWGV